MFKHLLCIISVFILASGVRADVIEFPDEELARESVLPVFDQPEAVKNRSIPNAKRLEVGAFAGAILNDPLFNIFPVGASLHYHLTEMTGFGVLGSYYASGQSSYVGQIKQLRNGDRIPFDTAPVAKFSVIAQYEFTPYYGKVSFTKQSVANLNLSFTAGVGTLATSDTASVLLAFGMNQRLFITKNIGFKADLEAFFYRQKDIIPNTPVDKNVVAFVFNAGVVYLLPGF